MCRWTEEGSLTRWRNIQRSHIKAFDDAIEAMHHPLNQLSHAYGSSAPLTPCDSAVSKHLGRVVPLQEQRKRALQQCNGMQPLDEFALIAAGHSDVSVPAVCPQSQHCTAHVLPSSSHIQVLSTQSC